jgi:predicted amidohydrolase YtcJ
VSSLIIRDCRLSGGELANVVVEDGRISRISQGAESVKAAETVDAGGSTILPAFVDTHCHPFSLGRLRRMLDLKGTSNIVSIRLRLQAKLKAARPGEWVLGRGWNHESFPEPRLPTRSDIDDISPDNPVLLTRVCGHIGLFNSRAMAELGLESGSGPEFERGANGTLTGVVKEGSLESASAKIPKGGPEEIGEDLLAADFEAAKNGLATLHCIISPDAYKEELMALASLGAAGSLSLRYRVFVPYPALTFLAEEKFEERLPDSTRVCGVKLFADGSLGARTAALREPYADDPSNSGILRYSDEELAGMVNASADAGRQVVIHAIGDRAVEQAARALAGVAGARNPLRHRIEHCSLAPKDLRSLMSKHSIGATVQPMFIVSDSWAAARLGEERIGDLYPLASMLREGIVISGSSDAPVETISPVLGMWASMVRAGYGKEENLDLQQAVALYTSNAAVNGGEEGSRGEVREGFAADLALMDTDLTKIHPAMLRKVGVGMTLVAGRTAFSYLGAAG